MNKDNIWFVYHGDLEKLQKVLSEKNDVNIYTVNNLMNASHNEEFRIGLVPLILKAEAEHPGQFLQYKALIDLVAQTKGVGTVIFSWRNPNFSKYTKKGSTTVQENLTVPVSKQMRTYLRSLEVREAENRRKKALLLQAIDENAKSDDPDGLFR